MDVSSNLEYSADIYNRLGTTSWIYEMVMIVGYIAVYAK